jgi:signal transduction histidine kinase
MNGIIQEMLTLLKGEATRCSITMGTDLAAELPKIKADRVQLQQVFMNLMLIITVSGPWRTPAETLR